MLNNVHSYYRREIAKLQQSKFMWENYRFENGYKAICLRLAISKQILLTVSTWRKKS